MVPEDSSVDRLAQAILLQGEAEAKKIRETAQATAEQLLAEAEQEAGRRRQATLVAEADRAKRESASVLAAAHLEARRRILESREELLDRAFAGLGERLAGVRKTPAYPRVLTELVREGVAALEGENFTVAVMPEDYEQAMQALNSTVIEGKRIEVRADEQVHSAGCIVWQSDRRSLYDNTFSSIMARNRLRLRALVAEILWGKETRWDEI